MADFHTYFVGKTGPLREGLLIPRRRTALFQGWRGSSWPRARASGSDRAGDYTGAVLRDLRAGVAMMMWSRAAAGEARTAE